MARINDKVYVETYHKSKGGKVYRNVYFRVTSKLLVEVPDILADSDEDAVDRAKAALEIAKTL